MNIKNPLNSVVDQVNDIPYKDCNIS